MVSSGPAGRLGSMSVTRWRPSVRSGAVLCRTGMVVGNRSGPAMVVHHGRPGSVSVGSTRVGPGRPGRGVSSRRWPRPGSVPGSAGRGAGPRCRPSGERGSRARSP
ncbi:hypothetical protein ACFFX0_06115 [Citricoccus parietis]|uniref:Uncharacterized protein n=1 Tax=Citricoccus parietis TaxID=592307 RepID=A0ABV5FVV8_9MICC